MARQEQGSNHSGASFEAFSDFNGQQLHNASFRGAEFKGKVTFHETQFSGATDFGDARFLGPVDFTGSTFNGDTTFSGATFREPAKFDNVTFGGKLDFKGARFAHDAHFAGCTFKDDTDFSGLEFRAWGLFNGSTFLKAITFAGAIFRGSGNFTETDFATDADFRGARFITYADFSRAHFRSKALFQDASMECKTIFNDVVFHDEAVFTNCRFTHPVNFKATRFQSAALFDRVILLQFTDFSNAHFAGSFLLAPPAGSEGRVPEIRFESVTLDQPTQVRFSNISFEKITLMGTNLRGVRFDNPRWPKRGMFRKRAVVWDEIQKEKPDARKLAQLYKDIRANLGAAGTTADTGDLYFSEMEVRRKQPRSDNDSLCFFRRYLSPYTLFWLTSGYGRRPFRLVVTAGIIALIYYIW